MTAAGFIAGGMNWKQALFTILLGNLIVLLPMLLNGHVGTKYGIPFPVYCRLSFGTKGAGIPAFMRAIIACGWFGIQTWIGGSAINALVAMIIPGWSDFTLSIWISFFIFWILNILIVWCGMELVKKFESISAPLLLAFSIGLLVWAVSAAGGFGPIIEQESKFSNFKEFFAFFIPALTGVVGFWSTLSLNIPDFIRFAKDRKQQMLGQTLGLPLSMTIFSMAGMFTASATVVIFGEAIWDPVTLISKFDSPIILILGVISIAIVTLTTNIAANIVAPAYSFSSIFPKLIDFRKGVLLTGFIGIIIMPWKLLSDYEAYVFGWLIGYSAFLGPIAGILIADYFLIRKTKINLTELYKEISNFRPKFRKNYNQRNTA